MPPEALCAEFKAGKAARRGCDDVLFPPARCAEFAAGNSGGCGWGFREDGGLSVILREGTGLDCETAMALGVVGDVGGWNDGGGGGGIIFLSCSLFVASWAEPFSTINGTLNVSSFASLCASALSSASSFRIVSGTSLPLRTTCSNDDRFSHDAKSHVVGGCL